jgi:hypothetical protein
VMSVPMVKENSKHLILTNLQITDCVLRTAIQVQQRAAQAGMH